MKNILLIGLSSNAFLTAAGGFSNSGTIVLETIAGSGLSNLTVTGGPLTNTATGVITAAPGTGGGRAITADVVNDGTIDIASSIANERPSDRDVRTKTLLSRSMSKTFFCSPTNLMLRDSPNASACSWSSGRSGPPPTTTADNDGIRSTNRPTALTNM